jgi:hypothetical protein
MFETSTLTEELERIALKDAWLTKIGAGEYPRETVLEFFEKVKALDSKALTDMARTFCYGKASHKRAIWSNAFKEAVCVYFQEDKFENLFTEDGRRGQTIARELHRRNAKRSELAKNAGRAAQALAVKVQLVAKMVEKHNAKMEVVGGNQYRISITATHKHKTKTHTFTVDANGIQQELPENSVVPVAESAESL